MAKRTKKSNKSFIIKVFIILILAGAGILFYSGYETLKKIYFSNVVLSDNESGIIYIPTGSKLEDVTRILYRNNLIIDKNSFEWLAEKMNYKNHIHPGRYSISNSMSNKELVTLLRSGQQEPVKLVFNNIRTLDQFTETISKQIEADKSSLLDLLENNEFLSKYGFKKTTDLGMFIPNTYKIYWNTGASQFIDRMFTEYNRFWNDKRSLKAKELKLSKVEVSILASIINEETNKIDEMPIIAGVYLNRLKKGMRLQADPTVKFAIGDFTVKRILNRHLTYDSPYNTYMYDGLPPGPICIPSVAAIDAVLNYRHHDYIYFCAKEDFSGYHNFARTSAQHIANAQKYQRALNRHSIFD